jgi:hypothetical protein
MPVCRSSAMTWPATGLTLVSSYQVNPWGTEDVRNLTTGEPAGCPGVDS